ncbi:MAG: hypothetical protein M1833_007138 [Piccolia ochrophora]|nr:MAG: hypothetical protein M1833_007138 [Piccolia ochrophora]
MDLQNDGRLHAAAQKEASELVLQHQQQNASHQGPETHRNYREHLKKGSHARSHSSGPYAIDMINGSVRARSRAMPVESSHAHDDDVEDPFWTAENTDKVSQQDSQADAIHRGPEPSRVHEFWDSPGKKAYLKLTFSKVAPKPASRRQSSGSRRNISGASGHSLFRNPEDQIYEEPEEDQVLSSKHVTIGDHQSAPLRTREINPSTDPRYERGMPRAKTLPGAKDKVSDFEIHEDKLPLSRNTIQGLRRHPTSTIGENVTEPNESGPRMRNGMEVRSDDIRNATSMKRKDRSPALPSPSFVSKNPERPIVSFDSDYKPRDMDRHQVPVGSTSPNYVTHSARVDISSSVTPPTIEIAAPSIQVESPTLPTTSFEPSETTSRPLPTPSSKAAGPSRAKPKYPLTASLASSSLHHAASVNRGSATCTECHSPIAGRIVSAGGARFHPECFTCFHCGEGLECVAFYPEPEQKRIERLARIEARQSGELVPELDGQGQAEDGDEGLRFYCHLDFHEFFSPRCRSCKTPIEGEVVVACGGEWHVGHFFCAECGDPFDPSTPFVEKDGYAWCVGCHTRRYSTRCRKCRKPVTDTVITALDAEWHAECFCCVECNGELTGGQYFVREEDQDPKPVCQKCEARRLKA